MIQIMDFSRMISIKSLPDDVDDRRRQTKKMAPTSTKSILVVGGAGALGRGGLLGLDDLRRRSAGLSAARPVGLGDEAPT